MTPAPSVPVGTVVRAQSQRQPSDCTVTALANLLCLDYEIALSALAQIHPNVVLSGAYAQSVRKAAGLLGVKLTLKRTIDWDEDTGVLVSHCAALKARHAVVLWRGTIVDDGRLWPQDIWRATRKARRCSLLVVA